MWNHKKSFIVKREKAITDGYIIDSHCYPNVSYKGPRFNPTEIFYIFTEREEGLFAHLSGLLAWIENARKQKDASLPDTQYLQPTKNFLQSIV